MGQYRIEVRVRMLECNEAAGINPTRLENDSFGIVISEADAESIDRCENAVLRTAYPAMREALSEHLSGVSEKKALENAHSSEIIVNSRQYRVDGEVGRFEFKTHMVDGGDKEQYNTACDLFSELGSREYYRTAGFKEVAMIYGDTEQSYSKTAAFINRIRYQTEGGTPYRTLRENTHAEGAELIAHIEDKARVILQEEGFSEDGTCLEHKEAYIENQPVTLSVAQVTEAIEKHQRGYETDEDILQNPVSYEDPEETVNITIDDVCVKKQKETREKQRAPKKEKRQSVNNTIVHVEKGGRSYRLNGYGSKATLCFLIAFILNNDLIGYRFQFFTDGHKTLNATILKMFSWYKNIGIILDWHHLEKKCKELLSMAMKGRVVRNEVLNELLPLLWLGMTAKAIAYLQEVPGSLIKDPGVMEKLMKYLERNTQCIPCYAVRKELGLRNSSAIGEKMNDLIVSDRQKNNGMSWSKPGSVALASITALKLNNEYGKWFEERDIEFKLAA